MYFLVQIIYIRILVYEYRSKDPSLNIYSYE